MLSSIYWYLIWQLFALVGVLAAGPLVLFGLLTKYPALL